MARKTPPQPPGPDDAALWNRVAREVRPLRRGEAVKTRAGGTGRAEPPPAPKSKSASSRATAASRAALSSALPPPPPLAAGTAPGLDKRNLNRLRRGQLSIDGRIDLHGMTRDEARTSLLAFLAFQLERGARCVLVITGKGVRGRGTGVIRAALPHWLNDAALRPGVVAFAEAQPKDGGAGAFYVYLRRRRSRLPQGQARPARPRRDR
jgi:DNA-nicking Smr family endonuclease